MAKGIVISGGGGATQEIVNITDWIDKGFLNPSLLVGTTTTQPDYSLIDIPVNINNLKYRRIGGAGEFRFILSIYDDNGGAVPGGFTDFVDNDYLFTLPDSLQFDPSVKMITDGIAPFDIDRRIEQAPSLAYKFPAEYLYGHGSFFDESFSRQGKCRIIPYDATRFKVIGRRYNQTLALNSSSNDLIPPSWNFDVTFTVPIAGWTAKSTP